MSLPTIALAVLLILIWTPVVAFLVSEALRIYRNWRDCRRLACRLKADAEAYRDLDLIHPIGRPRLGVRDTRRRDR